MKFENAEEAKECVNEHYTKRELLIFVWLKCGKDDMKTSMELLGRNRPLLKRSAKGVLTFGLSPLEKTLRADPEIVRKAIRDAGINPSEYYVHGDIGYDMRYTHGKIVFPRADYESAVRNYVPPKSGGQVAKGKNEA